MPKKIEIHSCIQVLPTFISYCENRVYFLIIRVPVRYLLQFDECQSYVSTHNNDYRWVIIGYRYGV